MGYINKLVRSLSQKRDIISDVRNNNIKAVTRHLKKITDCSVTDNEGNTLLHIASQRGLIDIVKLILDKLPMSIYDTNRQSHTALDIINQKLLDENVNIADQYITIAEILDQKLSSIPHLGLSDTGTTKTHILTLNPNSQTIKQQKLLHDYAVKKFICGNNYDPLCYDTTVNHRSNSEMLSAVKPELVSLIADIFNEIDYLME